ncbi:MAG: FHA domain-containing protein [Akkermansia sp.]|nr:FHA domain-containing protein [Akkermansia sp.]
MLNRTITVGQSPHADVRLSYIGISKRHLELSPTEYPGRYIVTDLQSTNGTRIVTPDRRMVKVEQPTIIDGHTPLLLGNYETTAAAIVSEWERNRGGGGTPGSRVRRDPITGEIING